MIAETNPILLVITPILSVITPFIIQWIKKMMQLEGNRAFTAAGIVSIILAFAGAYLSGVDWKSYVTTFTFIFTAATVIYNYIIKHPGFAQYIPEVLRNKDIVVDSGGKLLESGAIVAEKK